MLIFIGYNKFSFIFVPANKAFMNQRGKKKEYCILKDPHLIYHLQSPVKISHLLSSGLYELEENKIIEIETMQGL